MSQESFKFYSYKVIGSRVTLYTSKGEYIATIEGRTNEYYLCFPRYQNDKLFTELGINKCDFSRKVLGYSKGGNWPYNKTKEDLFKILDRLIIHSKSYDEY